MPNEDENELKFSWNLIFAHLKYTARQAKNKKIKHANEIINWIDSEAENMSVDTNFLAVRINFGPISCQCRGIKLLSKFLRRFYKFLKREKLTYRLLYIVRLLVGRHFLSVTLKPCMYCALNGDLGMTLCS